MGWFDRFLKRIYDNDMNSKKERLLKVEEMIEQSERENIDNAKNIFEQFVKEDRDLLEKSKEYTSKVVVIRGKEDLFIKYGEEMVPIKVIENISVASKGTPPRTEHRSWGLNAVSAKDAVICIAMNSGNCIFLHCNRHIVDFVLDDLRYAWVNMRVKTKE